MKKIFCVFISVLILFLVSCADSGYLKMELTVIQSMKKCDAVTDDCFFATDNDGEWYRVVWDDTDGIKEGDTLTVYYEEITNISYETGYPEGYTPSKQIIAKKVK